MALLSFMAYNELDGYNGMIDFNDLKITWLVGFYDIADFYGMTGFYG
jgi:hypothetical protein